MRDESLTLTMTPLDGAPRRLQLTPIPHPDATHRLVESEFDGRWRPTGSEFVTVELTRERDGLHGSYRGP